MPMRSLGGESAWPTLAERVSFLRGHAVVVLNISGAKRLTPVVEVREPTTAPLSAEDRQQAVTAMAVMIHQWWSGGRGRTADTVRGSGSPDDATADGHR